MPILLVVVGVVVVVAVELVADAPSRPRIDAQLTRSPGRPLHDEASQGVTELGAYVRRQAVRGSVERGGTDHPPVAAGDRHRQTVDLEIELLVGPGVPIVPDPLETSSDLDRVGDRVLGRRRAEPRGTRRNRCSDQADIATSPGATRWNGNDSPAGSATCTAVDPRRCRGTRSHHRRRRRRQRSRRNARISSTVSGRSRSRRTAGDRRTCRVSVARPAPGRAAPRVVPFDHAEVAEDAEHPRRGRARRARRRPCQFAHADRLSGRHDELQQAEGPIAPARWALTPPRTPLIQFERTLEQDVLLNRTDEDVQVPWRSMTTDASAPPTSSTADWQAGSPTASIVDGFVHVRVAGRLRVRRLLALARRERRRLRPRTIERESTLEPVDLPSRRRPSSAPTSILPVPSCSRWSDGACGRVHPGWLRYVADGTTRPRGARCPRRSCGRPPIFATRRRSTAPHPRRRRRPRGVADAARSIRTLPTRRHTDRPRLRRSSRRRGRTDPRHQLRAGLERSGQGRPGLDREHRSRPRAAHRPTRPARRPPASSSCTASRTPSRAAGHGCPTASAVVDAIRTEHPDAYDALTTLEWVFMNRSPDAEHRWIGPIIDHGSAAPTADPACVLPGPQRTAHGRRRHPSCVRVAARSSPRWHATHDSRSRTPFRPGDLVGFDNRRVLHGRDAFESGGVAASARLLRRPRRRLLPAARAAPERPPRHDHDHDHARTTTTRFQHELGLHHLCRHRQRRHHRQERPGARGTRPDRRRLHRCGPGRRGRRPHPRARPDHRGPDPAIPSSTPRSSNGFEPPTSTS